MKHLRRIRLIGTIFYLCGMVLCAALAFGSDLPKTLRDKIDQVFPEAKIIKTEEERYQGQMVMEVELVAKDGTPYEVYLSKDGNILKIEKEDNGFLWFK